VKANQDSWISAKADGKSVLSETLKASNEKTLHARDRIVLTLGNAAGVQVSYNGKSLSLGSTSGQVKTLIFTAQGSADADFHCPGPAGRRSRTALTGRRSGRNIAHSLRPVAM
jgi:hypothetical protein